MKIPFFFQTLVGLSFLVCWTSLAAAQTDDRLVQGSRRANEMKRMVREFITQAQELERQGDKAGALLMKNKALGLMKSLRTMSENEANPSLETTGDGEAAPPAVTRAEAVVTLNDSITLLNLLGQKELGRRIKIIIKGIATDPEIEEILEYDRQQKMAQVDRSPPAETKPEPDREEMVPQRSTEQVQNQLAALKTAMNSLLDAGQTEQAKQLARSIMLRRSALQAESTTWDYEDDYPVEREIELLRLAKKRLFETGEIFQSQVIEQLASQIERDKSATKTERKSSSPSKMDVEKQSELITRLVQKFEQSEEERVKLQSELRRLERLNESLGKQIEQWKAKDKQ